MKADIGIALLGAGDRGKVYARAFKKIEEVRFVSVFDPIAERSEDAQRRFGFARQCADFREAVTAPGVDAAVVCSPAYFHPEIAVFSMDNGRHVLCEKPMALSLAAASEMIAASQRSGRVLSIGLQYRNNGTFRRFKRAMEQGLIGRPVLMRFSDVREMRPKRAMHDARHGNGGPLVDMSCHFLDLMRWCFGSEPVQVSCRHFTFAASRPELAHFSHQAPDTGVMIVEFASGDVGEVSVCWGLPPQVNGQFTYDALGPLGMLQVTGGTVTVTREGNRCEEVVLAGEDADVVSDPELHVIREFLEAIEGKGSPSTGGPEAYVALATSLAALRSSAVGRPVRIEEVIRDMPDVVTAMHGQ